MRLLARIKRVDVILATGFLTIGVVEELTAPHLLPYWWLRLGFAALLVLVRRAAPLSTLVIDVLVVQILLLPNAVDDYRVWQAFCLFIGLHTVGREVLFFKVLDQSPLWRRVTSLALVLATITLLLDQRTTMPSDAFASIGYTTAAWLSGLLLQVQARRIAERNAAVAAADALLAGEAIAQERARIARELHDMVAHSVTVMVLQSAAVRRRLLADQRTEQELLAGVEAAGREAVTELRRTLGLLRNGLEPEHVPQPGLARLDELIEQVREAGLTVDLRTTGATDSPAAADPPADAALPAGTGPSGTASVPGARINAALPPSLDLSAFRIVQEALTNVLKHAGPTRAAVTVDCRPDELLISVVNDRPRGGPGPGAAVRVGTVGHGLVGMRERAALFGGDLRTGPTFSGGYEVTARLPLPRRVDQGVHHDA